MRAGLMPHSRYCQTEKCSNRTVTDHPHCPACEQVPPRRLHRAASDTLRRWRRCATTGCDQRAVHRATTCYQHQPFWEGWEIGGPAPRLKGPDAVCEFDVICLQCSQRRVARGTEAQANYTRQWLGPCPRCRGPQVVERADLGGISSPSRGHSVTFDAGRAGRHPGAA